MYTLFEEKKKELLFKTQNINKTDDTTKSVLMKSKNNNFYDPHAIKFLSSQIIQAFKDNKNSQTQYNFENPEISKTPDITESQKLSYIKAIQMKFGGNNTDLKQENNTGIPDELKTNVEKMSGLSMNDVRVSYNSNKPDQLGALAYTQGNKIFIASGQEKYLPHELGHVVQQKQGRVKPTMQFKGVNINNDKNLENEADKFHHINFNNASHNNRSNNTVQMVNKLILGRISDTGDYRLAHGDKEKRTLALPRGWNIDKNKEWIRTGKVGVEYDSNTPAQNDVGVDNEGMFKIISGIPDNVKTALRDNSWDRTIMQDAINLKWTGVNKLSAIGTATTTNSGFLRYLFSVCPINRFGFKDLIEYKRTSVPAGYQPTVLAQEIDQLIEAGYIFREVNAKAPSIKKHFMAFKDIAAYDNYVLARLARHALP